MRSAFSGSAGKESPLFGLHSRNCAVVTLVAKEARDDFRRRDPTLKAKV